MEFTTSYWQKEQWSRRAGDTLTSYGRCWNPSLRDTRPSEGQQQLGHRLHLIFGSVPWRKIRLQGVGGPDALVEAETEAAHCYFQGLLAKIRSAKIRMQESNS